ncbi:unnamed protein product, partial [Mesorhabditis belari]|uniref:SHSP domain-containing protein n=1 Tax=Mesorhabditis belari TaxID=2138241 RepID=A0AAF3FNW1_9BILA
MEPLCFLHFPVSQPKESRGKSRSSSKTSKTNFNMAFVPFDYQQTGWPIASPWMFAPSGKDAPDMHYDELQKADVGKGAVCNTPRRYSVTLDVHEFNPSDLKVQTKGRKIVVEGKHLEAENRFGSVTKFFKRKFKLPKECELSSVESRLSPQGILCIETKKRERKDSQNVPIVRDFADPFVVEEHF